MSTLPFTPPGTGEHRVLTSVLEVLRGLGLFARVQMGTSQDLPLRGGVGSPFAVLAPTGWVDQADPLTGARLRQLTYSLAIGVRLDDAEDRLRWLDALARRVQAAVAEATLIPEVYPESHCLDRGRYDEKAQPPESRLVLTGRVSFAVFS
jgi:hypothetical protein